MVHSQSTFLLKITILSLHEAQAPNGLFSMHFLIKNDHSESPRGAGSEWSMGKKVVVIVVVVIVMNSEGLNVVSGPQG